LPSRGGQQLWKITGGRGNHEYLVYCEPLQPPPLQQSLPIQRQQRKKDAEMTVWTINKPNTKKLLWCPHTSFGFAHELSARNATFKQQQKKIHRFLLEM